MAIEAAGSNQNIESLTLRQSLTTLTTAVSTDLPRVANRCFEVGLISTEQLEEAHQQKNLYSRANGLVRRVIDQVTLDPRKFQSFLNILEESGMFESVVREVQNKYTENQDVRKLTINIDTHEMTDGQVQNRVKNEKGRGRTIKHLIHARTYIFRQWLIMSVACAVADFLDPVNYIFTDSEYCGIPVSYKAKCIILLVVVCVITIIAMKYGCDHHVYCYENSYRGPIIQPIYTDVLTHLVFSCILSYLCNWLIPNLHVTRLFIYIVTIAVDTLLFLYYIVY